MERSISRNDPMLRGNESDPPESHPRQCLLIVRQIEISVRRQRRSAFDRGAKLEDGAEALKIQHRILGEPALGTSSDLVALSRDVFRQLQLLDIKCDGFRPV